MKTNWLSKMIADVKPHARSTMGNGVMVIASIFFGAAACFAHPVGTTAHLHFEADSATETRLLDEDGVQNYLGLRITFNLHTRRAEMEGAAYREIESITVNDVAFMVVSEKLSLAGMAPEGALAPSVVLLDGGKVVAERKFALFRPHDEIRDGKRAVKVFIPLSSRARITELSIRFKEEEVFRTDRLPAVLTDACLECLGGNTACSAACAATIALEVCSPFATGCDTKCQFTEDHYTSLDPECVSRTIESQGADGPL